MVFDVDVDFVTEGVILSTVVRAGVTEVRIVLVLGLVVTSVDVLPEREADSLIVVRIVILVLLVVVDGFTMFVVVDGEFGMLEAVEDLELTELVEAGDPLTEDEEEGRRYP